MPIYLKVDWTTLFNVILAANLLGIHSLIELACAKVAIALKFPRTGDHPPIIYQDAFAWPDITFELTQMQQCSRAQEEAAEQAGLWPALGDLVRIKGLTSPNAIHLNGKLEQVIAAFPQTERTRVSLLDKKESSEIRIEVNREREPTRYAIDL